MTYARCSVCFSGHASPAHNCPHCGGSGCEPKTEKFEKKKEKEKDELQSR